MDYRQSNYFSNLNMHSFKCVHLQICQGVGLVSNPLLAHAVESYRLLVNDFAERILPTATENLNECNRNRVQIYNMCRAAARCLVSYNSHADKEVVSQLSRAFGVAVSGLEGYKRNSVVEKAFAIVSQIPVEQLKAVAMGDCVEGFLDACNEYEQGRRAIYHNLRAGKDPEILSSRRSCHLAYKCMMSLVEEFSRQGDEGCREFLTWLKKQ